MAQFSELEKSMIGLIAVFHKYSGKEGDKYKLNKGEAKTLLQTELGFCKTGLDDSKVADVMQRMDFNKDGEMDFQEFAILVAGVTIVCREFFESGNQMCTDLEKVMKGLFVVFHSYSGKEGDKTKLSKGELKDLLETELGDFIKDNKEAPPVEKILNDLDLNKNGQVDFEEFVLFVALVTIFCHEFFKESEKRSEQSGGKCSKK